MTSVAVHGIRYVLDDPDANGRRRVSAVDDRTTKLYSSVNLPLEAQAAFGLTVATDEAPNSELKAIAERLADFADANDAPGVALLTLVDRVVELANAAQRNATLVETLEALIEETRAVHAAELQALRDGVTTATAAPKDGDPAPLAAAPDPGADVVPIAAAPKAKATGRRKPPAKA